MTQKSPTINTQIELVQRHELTKKNLAVLAATGAKVGPADLFYFISRLEKARLLFGATAVGLGIELLRKKAATPHGQFEDILVGLIAKGEAASLLTEDERKNAIRQLRVYMQLGRSFLCAIESGDGRLAAQKGLKVKIPPHVQGGSAIVEHLLNLPREQLLEAIETFVTGKSVRQMLAEFRDAAKAAALEELADENQRGHSPLTADEKTAAARLEAEQLYFEDILPRVRENFLADQPTFELLPRADRQKIADSLHAAYQRVKKSL